MALSSGTHLGPYEIVALIGAGGMGEVYRARDTRLGREIAIKILPDAVALDPDRIARFEREAKTLAAVNHPQIATLYGIEQSGERHFLVMELVEGQTLAERLQRGPIPVEEALPIARQIAEALEAAHEKGIIHRDLKPANVKITPDEKIKVLDFGLAKAMEKGPGDAAHGASPANLTQSPTLSVMATQAGVILGTAAYMSPEQAKGFAADQRSDVFSFGVVLYEMLTGRPPFQGETVSDVLASVLARAPDLGALPPGLNPRIHELIGRCIEKNPKRRWQAVGDLRAEIETIAAAPRAMPTIAGAAQAPLWRRAIPALALAIMASAVTGAAVWWRFHSVPAPIVARFTVPLGEDQRFTVVGRQLVGISPDGTQIVYVANQRLYLRSMSDVDARPIPGSEGAERGSGNPVFAPDGRSIAFVSTADRALKRIATTGGTAVTICSMDPAVYGMTWSDDGILFGQAGKGIMRVSADGGSPELLIGVKDTELAHGPQLLPGGQDVLFTLASAGPENKGHDVTAGRFGDLATTLGASAGTDMWDKAQIVVESLRSKERTVLLTGGSDARYLPTRHLVYAVGGVLFAVPFDVARRAVTGGPVPIVEGVTRALGSTGTAQFSVSQNGSLVYVPGSSSGTSLAQLGLARIDRKGTRELLNLPPAPYEFPRVSPDGKLVAVGTDDGRETIVWIYDLSGASARRRLTFGGRNRFPIWSPDGQRVAFESDREGDRGLFWQRADGTGTAERLTKADQGTFHIPQSWSSDGKTILFSVAKPSAISLWTLSLDGKQATSFGGVQSADRVMGAAFSPDGRWVAYDASEPGGPLFVYVQPFPATGAKYQIGDGGNPFWSRDGKDLFAFSNGRLLVTSITTQPAFSYGNRAMLAPSLSGPGTGWRNIDILPGGDRFVRVVAAETADSASASRAAPAAHQLRVVLNWFEELKTRVPTK